MGCPMDVVYLLFAGVLVALTLGFCLLCDRLMPRRLAGKDTQR